MAAAGPQIPSGPLDAALNAAAVVEAAAACARRMCAATAAAAAAEAGGAGTTPGAGGVAACPHSCLGVPWKARIEFSARAPAAADVPMRNWPPCGWAAGAWVHRPQAWPDAVSRGAP